MPNIASMFVSIRICITPVPAEFDEYATIRSNVYIEYIDIFCQCITKTTVLTHKTDGANIEPRVRITLIGAEFNVHVVITMGTHFVNLIVATFGATVVNVVAWKRKV